MATLATYGIATAEIERPGSPSPSEGSNYYDLNDEVEIPSDFISSIQAGTTTPSESSTPVENVSEQIEVPSTPPRPTHSLQTTFSTPEVSPSSSSDRSSSSAISSNTDLQSPITVRSCNSSIDLAFNFEHEPQTPLPQRTKPESCLQCRLAGMACSFSGEYHKNHPERPHNDRTCTRCSRNGESLCIGQIKIEKEPDRSSLESYFYVYYAEGVDNEVVQKRAGRMLEEEAKKTRFSLPKGSLWKRARLTSVFGGCWRKEDADEG